VIVRAVEFYQRWISPALHSISGVGGACRFQPTCSEYAAVALARHGVFRGAALSLWRLLRCNPFSRAGCDPVPASGCDPGPQADSVAGVAETNKTVVSVSPRTAENARALLPLRHG
jgi:uncharacterized protein